MIFPNSEKALMEILSDFGRIVNHIPDDLAKTTPVVQVTPVPHSDVPERYLRQERYQLEVFNRGRTPTKDLADSIVTHLDGNYFLTDQGLIDKVEVVVLPAEVGMEDDTLNSFTISVLTNTRPLN